ncbi:SH3 domain-containing protein [Flavobacteriaceae bacterium M23B6Z8]
MKKYVLYFCLLFTAIIYAQEELFHDETFKDKSFFEFTLTLKKAIQDKNPEVLKTILADSVEDGFGNCGYCAKSAFINNHFGPDQKNHWWNVLKSTIRFGFARVEKEGATYFQAPAWYQKYDSEKELVILGENVNVRKRASVKAEVIDQLSFTKAACFCGIEYTTEETYVASDGYQWVQITLPDGRKGYIVTDFSSLGDAYYKELSVEKIDGEWKITSFFNPAGC